jgi:GntR family transcriptional regulator
VDVEALVVVRRRLSVVNGEPVALCDSCYPPDVAEGRPPAEPERIIGGAGGLIEDPGGPIARRLKRSFDDLECRCRRRGTSRG